MCTEKTNCLFIIPNIPIPRHIKRITAAQEIGSASVFYWNRMQGTDCKNKMPEGVAVDSIDLQAKDGVPLSRIPQTFRFVISFYKQINSVNPNVIYITKTEMLFFLALRLFIKREIRHVIYEVSDMHDLAYNTSTRLKDRVIRRLLNSMEKFSSKYVDKLIVTSNAFWDMYYSQFYPKEKVMFIPNMPELHVFENYRPKSEGKYTIGFIGNVRYIRQLKLLIDVCEELSCNVLIAGYGNDLQDIIKYCAGKNHVNIYGKYSYEKEISKLYGMIDCTFSMYDTDSENVKIALPNRLYESTLCGLPLIASKGTLLGTIVQENNIGKVVQDLDKEGLKKSIEYIKRNKKVLSDNCLRYANSMSLENNKEKFQAVLEM